MSSPSSPEADTSDKSKILQAGLRGRCPNCCEGSLFAGYLKFARECASCGYDYQKNDMGDGPAVFVILLASIMVVPFALVYQIKADAPVWLTLLLFVPLIIGVCLALLRPFRGLMFAMQVMSNAIPAEHENTDFDHED